MPVLSSGAALSCFNLSKTCRWDFVGTVAFTKLRLSPWRELSSPGILGCEIGRGPTFLQARTFHKMNVWSSSAQKVSVYFPQP